MALGRAHKHIHEMQDHVIPHPLQIVICYHVTQLLKWEQMSSEVVTYKLYAMSQLYRKTYIAKWIMDTNHNVSMMFGTCIMIVGIMNTFL